jgi:hypothetical protein
MLSLALLIALQAPALSPVPPMDSGDRLYADQDARAELEAGDCTLRLGAATDLTIANLTDDFLQVSMSSGTLRVTVYDLSHGDSIEVDTPNGAFLLRQAGTYRVDVSDPDGTTTIRAAGRPAVRGAYEAVFANIRIAIHFTVDELTVQGDVAYARTHSAGTATVVATGASGPEANRELFVFVRGASGWKIARYMFNKAS